MKEKSKKSMSKMFSEVSFSSTFFVLLRLNVIISDVSSK
jgi:hypothetical protein